MSINDHRKENSGKRRPPIKHFIEIQHYVNEALIRMYDRYMQVAICRDKGETMSFLDFANQLITRGMCEYNNQLLKMEIIK